MSDMDDLCAEVCSQLGLTVQRPLKRGGQKTVHLVEQSGDPRVLKLIEIGSSDPSAFERAKREFDLLATTSHPHLVEVKSSLIQLNTPVEGVAWLEEYLDGDDLSDRLGQQWDEVDVRALGLGVGAGLSALHAQGVVHRDLSANNVRCLTDGTYKVMDPGWAKHTLRSGITIGGQPGTPGFITPEHLQPYSGPTAASDVFGVGILMYAASTGRLPFPYSGDDADYVRRLMANARPPLLDLNPGLCPDLAAFIERCLHPQPARRFRNAGRLILELVNL